MLRQSSSRRRLLSTAAFWDGLPEMAPPSLSYGQPGVRSSQDCFSPPPLTQGRAAMRRRIDPLALSRGKCMHATLIASGRPDRDLPACNILLHMYGKCSQLGPARALFERLPRRNSCSWNILVSACSRLGRAVDALALICRMDAEGAIATADGYTFNTLFTACAGAQALPEGKTMHARAASMGIAPESDIVTGPSLVNLYGRCGRVADARRFLDRMHKRDECSWNSMVVVYTQWGWVAEAVEALRHMQIKDGIAPDNMTFAPLLFACANHERLPEGKLTHACAVESGIELDTLTGNALLNMYAKCSSVPDAKGFFERMQCRDTSTWNTMIGAHAQSGHVSEALELLLLMQLEGLPRTHCTFASILSSFANEGESIISGGKFIHASIASSVLTLDISTGNALISMYGKCGCLAAAQTLFKRLHPKNIVTWTTIISLHAQCGKPEDAFELFRLMVSKGEKPNEITFCSILDASTELASLVKGKTIHAHIIAHRFEEHAGPCNALLTMYGNCGCPKDARAIFTKLYSQNGQDIVSWNAMIAAHAQNGDGVKAFETFHRMYVAGVKPGRITFLSLMDACISIASFSNGRVVHARIVASGLPLGIVEGSSLANMYGKCGSPRHARAVFDKMPERNVCTWNAMISAYAQNGDGQEALEFFRRMRSGGIEPDKITFLSVLHACSHAGLPEHGCRYFDSMVREWGITPLKEHYMCMIDLLGRAGWLKDAEKVFRSMPYRADAVAWSALLGACRTHGDTVRGHCIGGQI